MDNIRLPEKLHKRFIFKDTQLILAPKDNSKHWLKINLKLKGTGDSDTKDDEQLTTIITVTATHNDDTHEWTLGIEDADQLSFSSTNPLVTSPITAEPSSSGWDGTLQLSLDDDKCWPIPPVLLVLEEMLKCLKNRYLQKYIDLLRRTLTGFSAEDISHLTTWDLYHSPFNITSFKDAKDLEIFFKSYVSQLAPQYDSLDKLDIKDDGNNVESQYKTWKTDDILKWLDSLGDDKYDLLKKGIIESEITGTHLPYLTTMDLSLPPFNVKNFSYTKDFQKQFTLLKLKYDNDCEDCKVNDGKVDESQYKTCTIDGIEKGDNNDNEEDMDIGKGDNKDNNIDNGDNNYNNKADNKDNNIRYIN